MLQRAWAALQNALHITEWLPEYTIDTLRADATAGLTVGVMLIPQGMAYAVIAGLPPIYGLYAGLVPLLTYPLFGTSRQLAVGPQALDMLILVAGLGPVAESLEEMGIELHVTGLIGPVREVVRRSGLYGLLGEDRFHLDPHEAVVRVLERWDAQDDGSRVEDYFAATDREKKESTPAAS